jgi:hypothetical protein
MRVRELEEELERREPERPPAPSRPHALLTLQQGAGNQAVTRMIARQKIKPALKRTQVANANRGKPKPTPEQALLKIYNVLRAELDEDPGEFTELAAAASALIEGKVIDGDDVTEFSGLLGVSAVKKDPMETIKENVKLDRSDIDRRFKHHIFDGDFDDKKVPTGYHSTSGGSKTHEAYGTKSDVDNTVSGVYQQSVRAKTGGKKKGTQSTFFPDTASQEDILDAIATVYGKKHGSGTTAKYPESLKGMTLVKIGDTTVFPTGGSGISPE